MEMLVKMAEVLVKIAVMMMALGGVPAPPEARGRGPPFFFFFLDLLPRWEKGFPALWSLAPMAWEGREPLRDWIYLSVYAFPDSALAPFLLYPEIRNSDWIETFTQIFFQKLAFLRPKKRSNRLTGCLRESRVRLPPWGVPPCLVPPSGTVSC